MFEKRGDYQMFIYSLGKEKWPELTAALRDFMNAVVENVYNVDEIVRLSKEYGESHVQFKANGFKPDFWVTMTDAMTT
uniref:Uncharacterized protein n=1 Tax=Plectus sambesii TaxID=2011161 RepID=A0A914VLK7_9BILA